MTSFSSHSSWTRSKHRSRRPKFTFVESPIPTFTGAANLRSFVDNIKPGHPNISVGRHYFYSGVGSMHLGSEGYERKPRRMAKENGSGMKNVETSLEYQEKSRVFENGKDSA
jgi:hypothetical protein